MATIDINVKHFWLRHDDGSETTATGLAAKDTVATLTLSGSDLIFRLRLALDCTGSSSSSDIFGLKYSYNGGAATTITSSTAKVQGAVSANLTNGANTTQQLGPTDAGDTYVTKPGVVNNTSALSPTAVSLSVNNETELEWALLAKAAALNNGDTLDFTFFINSGTGTPIQFGSNIRLTISKQTSVSASDTGTGSETLSISATPAASDTGTGTETLSIAATLSVSDTGTGADSLTLEGDTSVSDTGAGSEALSIAGAVAASDSGVGSESFSIQIIVADTGLGTESLSIAGAVGVTDSGQGVDTSGMPDLVVLDSGIGRETLLLDVLGGRHVHKRITGCGDPAHFRVGVRVRGSKGTRGPRATFSVRVAVRDREGERGP